MRAGSETRRTIVQVSPADPAKHCRADLCLLCLLLSCPAAAAGSWCGGFIWLHTCAMSCTWHMPGSCCLGFPTCQLRWGLRVLHQQEGCALACVRRALKLDIPGEEIAGLLGSVPSPPPPSPFPSLISPISFLLDFSLPHLRFLEKGGWERKFSVRTFSTTLHFYCAYDNGPPESSWF